MVMVSRLIIKNLPQTISQGKLKEVFQAHGTITDIKLSYTKNGKFRRFAFVGYKTIEEAAEAKKYLDNSLLLNQKIKVEDCRDFNNQISGDKSKSKDIKFLKKDEKRKNIEKAKDKSDLEFLKMKISDDMEIGEEVQEKSGLDNSDAHFLVKLQTSLLKLSEKQIAEFLYPTKPSSVKITKSKGKTVAMLKFSSESDRDKAMKFNGDCINGKVAKLTLVKSENDFKSNKAGGQWKINDGTKEKISVEEIAESGRIFVRNLAFVCTEEDLEKLFSEFGPLSEVHIPIDTDTRKNMGIGFVTFMIPEHAIVAYNKIDGSVFQGRMIHLLPSKDRVEKEPEASSKTNTSSYKREKDKRDKSKSQFAYNWNTLFIGTDAVAGAIAEKYSISKDEFLNADEKGSAAVRLALGETQIVQETRQFLIDNGISLDSFSQPNRERSKCVLLAKNLPAGATALELRTLFEPHGDLGRVLLAPSGVTAVIEFLEPTHARKAFVSLAYRKFHFKPLYLEWAPTDIFCKTYEECKNKEIEKVDENTDVELDAKHSPSDIQEDGTTIFVKNLNFDTTEDTLKEHFCKCGEISHCTISKKMSAKKEILSMGYGFVQYLKKDDAEKAIKTLQNTEIDGHAVELKLSKRNVKNPALGLRKKQTEKEAKTGKILIRNIPFQANQSEIKSLFSTFGELKSVRLPKKLKTGGTAGSHRGFAFVDFISKQEAESAFKALCHSTHLYGRRLVLEWADTEDENIESLRRKAAESMQGNVKRVKTSDDFKMTLLTQSIK